MLNIIESIPSANNDFHLMLYAHAKWCFVLKLFISYAGIRLNGCVIEGQGLRERLCHIREAIIDPTFLLLLVIHTRDKPGSWC